MSLTTTTHSDAGATTVVLPRPALSAVAPPADVSVRVLEVRELRDHLDAWQQLADAALEPNVFHEPCLLLPALDHLAAGESFEFLVFEAPSKDSPEAPRQWCGFIPLVRRRIGPLRLECRSFWSHLHCYLGTPLVRGDSAEKTVAALVRWIGEFNHGRSLWKFHEIAGDGPLNQLLIQELGRRHAASWVAARHCRALFERQASSEEFLQQALSSKRRQELRRQGKRLAELGAVEYRVLRPGDELEPWLADFFEVESSGWKGREGTALGMEHANRAFFRSMATAAHRRGQLLMTALGVGGRPIALNCKLTSGAGGFAFKTAYLEEFKNYSPGVLLEAHNVELHHAQAGLHWFDSCSDPDHPMINSLWRGRRTLESVWIAGNSRTARTALAALPLARELRRSLRRSS